MKQPSPASLILAAALALAANAVSQDEAAALFKARCAKCHALDGSGKTPGEKSLAIPDLRASKVQRQSDQELFESVAHGKGHHKYPHVFSEQGLSDPQIRLLVKHVRTFAPPRN